MGKEERQKTKNVKRFHGRLDSAILLSSIVTAEATGSNYNAFSYTNNTKGEFGVMRNVIKLHLDQAVQL